MIDQSAIEAYTLKVKLDIIQLLKASGHADPNKVFEQELKQYNKNWKSNTTNLLKIVSAKNYLLPILQHRVNHCIGKGKMLIKNESIKLFLANNSELKRLQFLTDKIK
ncbi:MAG: hypothetical protein RIF39_05770 [Cyclobacteriaceae bacterium]